MRDNGRLTFRSDASCFHQRHRDHANRGVPAHDLPGGLPAVRSRADDGQGPAAVVRRGAVGLDDLHAFLPIAVTGWVCLRACDRHRLASPRAGEFAPDAGGALYGVDDGCRDSVALTPDTSGRLETGESRVSRPGHPGNSVYGGRIAIFHPVGDRFAAAAVVRRQPRRPLAVPSLCTVESWLDAWTGRVPVPPRTQPQPASTGNALVLALCPLRLGACLVGAVIVRWWRSPGSARRSLKPSTADRTGHPVDVGCPGGVRLIDVFSGYQSALPGHRRSSVLVGVAPGNLPAVVRRLLRQ